MKLVVFDTETGGFDASKDAILTLGLVLVDGDKLANEELEVAINDLGLVSKEALAVNDIDHREHQKHALQPQEACAVIDEWLTLRGFGQYEPVELCGHNMAFDVPFLRRLWETLGHRRYRTRFSHKLRCTMTLATMMKEAGVLDISDSRLCAVANFFGIAPEMASGSKPQESYHSALTDARVTAKVYLRLMERLRGIMTTQRELL